MLEIHDRETTSIIMAQSVAKGFREEGFDYGHRCLKGRTGDIN